MSLFLSLPLPSSLKPSTSHIHCYHLAISSALSWTAVQVAQRRISTELCVAAVEKAIRAGRPIEVPAFRALDGLYKALFKWTQSRIEAQSVIADLGPKGKITASVAGTAGEGGEN